MQGVTFKNFRRHPGGTALVVGHVSVGVARRTKVTDSQDGAPADQQQAAGRQTWHR